MTTLLFHTYMYQSCTHAKCMPVRSRFPQFFGGDPRCTVFCLHKNSQELRFQVDQLQPRKLFLPPPFAQPLKEGLLERCSMPSFFDLLRGSPFYRDRSAIFLLQPILWEPHLTPGVHGLDDWDVMGPLSGREDATWRFKTPKRQPLFLRNFLVENIRTPAAKFLVFLVLRSHSFLELLTSPNRTDSEV